MYTDFLIDINALFKENMGAALKYLDKVLLMKYVSRGRNPFDLRNQFDDLTLQIEGMGLSRSLLLEKWLTGVYTGPQCHKLVNATIDTRLTIKPKSTTLKLMRDVSAITFHVDKLSKIVQLDDRVSKWINILHRQGSRIYLFGNMDLATFRALQGTYQDIFSMVTESFISGQHGILKPDKDFYQTMIAHFGINVFKTFIIDDTERDLKQARSLGISGATIKEFAASRSSSV